MRNRLVGFGVWPGDPRFRARLALILLLVLTLALGIRVYTREPSHPSPTAESLYRPAAAAPAIGGVSPC